MKVIASGTDNSVAMLPWTRGETAAQGDRRACNGVVCACTGGSGAGANAWKAVA